LIKEAEFTEKCNENTVLKDVFIDEAGFYDKNSHRLYGYAQGSERILGIFSGKRCTKMNMIAGQCYGEILAPVLYAENMNTEYFNRYLTENLLPILKKGQRVILDNAKFHKILPKTKQAFDEKECLFLYLPPYSPHLNPIEKLWARIKKLVKNLCDSAEKIQKKIITVFSMINASTPIIQKFKN
jgi:isfu1 transposase